jgi:hypothetical protein
MPQYFVGDQWSDPDRFTAWAAGFFDRGGRIILRGRTGRVSLTVTARDVEALHGLRDAYRVGDIESHPKVERLWIWRVDRPEDARTVLTALLPFLTSKGDAARTALDRIRTSIDSRAARAERDRRILALREMGRPLAEIAEIVGTTQHVVANVVYHWRKENGITIRSSPRGKRP